MPFQGRFGGESGVEGHALLGKLGFPGQGLAAGAGEIADVVLPLGVLEKFLFHGRVAGIARGAKVVLGHGAFRLALLLGGFLEKGVFQKLLLHAFQELQPGKLQELDGLLQLGGHHQLLGKFELLSQFESHFYRRARFCRFVETLRGRCRRPRPTKSMPQLKDCGNPPDCPLSWQPRRRFAPPCLGKRPRLALGPLGRGHEFPEKRVRMHGAGFELGVELAAEEPRMVRQFDHFHEFAVRGQAA